MRRALRYRVMVMAIATALALSLAFGSVAGCTQSNSPSDSVSEQPETIEESESAPVESQPSDLNMGEIYTAIGAASTQFGFDLFSAVLNAEGNTENLLISPSSVAFALMMTYNGAAAETQEAITTTLRLPERDQAEVNAAYRDLLSYLEQPSEDVEVAIANSLWVRQDVELNPEFVESMQTDFDAEVAAMDFENPDTPNTINAWVSEQTKGNIPTIVESIDPDLVLFLINAVYFNGDWTFAFDPEQTGDRPFTLLDGTEVDHPLMSQSNSFDYLETDQLQAIRLPYGANSGSSEEPEMPAPAIRMTVLLPRESLAWEEFLALLTAENWNAWQTQFSNQDGLIALPRFKIEDQMPLNQPLKDLGMAIAFDPATADFSNLSDLSTVISQVQHRTFIDVTEEGTEAAATTSVGISITSVQEPSTPFEMTVDRPFAFAISDTSTQTLLFLGTVTEP
ncbi:MAG: serpin family protein [Elainellaceae cyanobacterium]